MLTKIKQWLGIAGTPKEPEIDPSERETDVYTQAILNKVWNSGEETVGEVLDNGDLKFDDGTVITRDELFGRP